MPWRLARLTLLVAMCACDAPPPVVPAPPPAVQDTATAAPPSKQQFDERSVRCDQAARVEFRSELPAVAEFRSHYNAKLDTCFYLLTLNQGTLSSRLIDINTRELYGEYLGSAIDASPPDGMPTACKVESMYCASKREWDVLVAPYMEEK